VGPLFYSFNHKSVHFIGLNNSQQIDKLGKLGDDQLAWLKNDLGGLSASTPIVVPTPRPPHTKQSLSSWLFPRKKPHFSGLASSHWK
jgi:hypothetical protein